MSVPGVTHFPGSVFNVEKMQNDVLEVQKHYEYNFKALGWSSIPLRSLNGKIKHGISDACGEHLSSNYTIFHNTSASEMTLYLIESMQNVAGRRHLLKARLLKLNAHSEISQHQDIFIGEDAAKVIRYHIPIFTNPDVIFTVGGTSYHLEAGNLYRVNTALPHSVKNSGNTDRVHLVFDVVG